MRSHENAAYLIGVGLGVAAIATLNSLAPIVGQPFPYAGNITALAIGLLVVAASIAYLAGAHSRG